MKNFAEFIALTALVILVGYISFNEIRLSQRSGNARQMTDSEVADIRLTAHEGPLPAISLDVPKDATFAGEPVPLQLPDVYERLDKELQINTYFHSNTLFLIKRANRWLPQIQEILREHGVPDDFKYLPLIESNLLNDISPKQAVGYWQILRDAGRENGLEINSEVDERYDPLKATEAACRYLKKAYARFGNWTLVAASYNRGMAGMQRALDNQRADNYYDLYLNEETSRYVFRIIAIKEIVENPARYGFRVSPQHLYQEEPLRHVEVNETITDLVDFARKQGINYKLLKRHNPWLRDDRLTVRRGQSYRIAIPELSLNNTN